MTAETVDTATFGQEWAAWHRKHETVRADPHGFLAVTGLHWLAPGPQRFPDAPGAWSTGPDGVTVTLGDAEDLVVDGVPVRGTYEFGIIPEAAASTRWPGTPSSRSPGAAGTTSPGILDYLYRNNLV